MGRTGCTEPQCLYKGALYLFTFNVVYLTPHSLLVPWSRKSRAIPLLPLWALRPVQSPSACTGALFTFLLLTLCIPGISHFTEERSVLCILDHILIIAPTCFGVQWQHLQGALFNCKFLETHQMFTRTLWPHTARSHALFNTGHTNFNKHQSLFIYVCVCGFWDS